MPTPARLVAEPEEKREGLRTDCPECGSLLIPTHCSCCRVANFVCIGCCRAYTGTELKQRALQEPECRVCNVPFPHAIQRFANILVRLAWHCELNLKKLHEETEANGNYDTVIRLLRERLSKDLKEEALLPEDEEFSL